MNKCKNLSKIGEFKRPKRPRITPTVSVVRTVLNADGLVSSVVEFVQQPKDQYRDQNWRNYQIQTIIQLGATDLLKELEPLAVSPLNASDGISRVSLALSDLNDYVKSIKTKQSEVKESPATSDSGN